MVGFRQGITSVFQSFQCRKASSLCGSYTIMVKGANALNRSSFPRVKIVARWSCFITSWTFCKLNSIKALAWTTRSSIFCRGVDISIGHHGSGRCMFEERTTYSTKNIQSKSSLVLEMMYKSFAQNQSVMNPTFPPLDSIRPLPSFSLPLHSPHDPRRGASHYSTAQSVFSTHRTCSPHSGQQTWHP